jgi:hypothetical protein
MDRERGQDWVRAALLVGLVYFLIGRLFSLPTERAHAWRLSAWAVSAIVYAAHIAYEHFTLRDTPRTTALHAAFAAAMGAFALALGAMAHTMSTGATLGSKWLLAIAVWPIGTALPAFLVAWALAAMLTRLSPRGETK